MATCRPDEIRDLVATYFHATLYLFVPNVCNARCDFCYVSPVHAEHAELPKGVLEKARSILLQARQAGFAEVKVTGGEPLLFSNVHDLFRIVTEAGMRLTILTNGIRLLDHLKDLMINPPSHVILSVHSLGAAAGEILGVPDARQEAALQALRTLAEVGNIRTTVSFVGLRPYDMGVSALPRLISESTEIKAIRATDINPDLELTSEDFDSRLDDFRTLDRQGIRVTDTSYSRCDLERRGFFSVLLPSGRATPCCVAVDSTASLVKDASKPGALKLAVRKAYEQRCPQLATAPCSTSSGHCPLALRDLGIR